MKGGCTMMHYRLFCPLAKASEIFAERWTPLVVQELRGGSSRFNDIRRGIPLISRTLLSQRLKELERVGIVERRGSDQRASGWHLTEAGMALGPALDLLSEWGLNYAQNPLEEGDLDVAVLTWNIHKRVDPAAFPDGRTTVHFEFTDAPQGTQLWWLVNAGGTVDLCPFDPGFPVDLYITTDLRTMISIWFGRVTWDAGVRSGTVEVIGSRTLRDRMRHWLLLAPIRVTNRDVAQSKPAMRRAADAIEATESRVGGAP
jgi:DNA-binding HxlR family transcriptional regulator